jgi:tol-pal system protein YbgF
MLLPPQARDLQQDIYEIKVQVGRLQTLQGDTYKLLHARIKEEEQSQEARHSTLSKKIEELEHRIKKQEEEIRELRLLLEELRFNLKEGQLFTEDDSNRLSTTRNRSKGTGIPGDITITEDGETIDGKALMNSSSLFFSNGKYEEARQCLRKYLEHFPNSSQAHEAQFLLADTYYYEGNYNDAERNFLKLAETYSASNRVPDSLVKAAMCQEKLERKSDACATLTKVIKNYPGYHEMFRVRNMLKDLENK